MDEKLVRQILYVIIGIIAILAAITLVQTLLQMIVPIAIIAIGGFAFYKLVLEGRDEPDAMEDEVAETSNMVVQGTAEPVTQTEAIAETVEQPAPEETEKQAEERLSAVEKAQRDYVDNVTPAEEILDQIKARRQRLQGDDEA